MPEIRDVLVNCELLEVFCVLLPGVEETSVRASLQNTLVSSQANAARMMQCWTRHCPGNVEEGMFDTSVDQVTLHAEILTVDPLATTQSVLACLDPCVIQDTLNIVRRYTQA
ncbi:MAG: hypothetical protein AB8B91_25640 [Rubripirellula sp.]